MSLDACAELVERGDPDRWLTVLAAPLEARRRLLPIYAFNVEVARAPWVTAEPMIAEMRLQWWADALDEIADGGPVRRHEVTSELAGVLDRDGARILAQVVEARRRDAWGESFSDISELQAYLQATGGSLMWAATRALGTPDAVQDVVRAHGSATAAAAWISAVPALIAAGRRPLPGDQKPAVVALANWGLAQSVVARQGRSGLPRASHPALWAGWMARPILRMAQRDPERAAAGAIGFSEARRKARLLRMRHLGGW